MLSILEFADIIDYIFCNYVEIKRIPIQDLRHKNIIIDSFVFSKNIKNQKSNKN